MKRFNVLIGLVTIIFVTLGMGSAIANDWQLVKHQDVYMPEHLFFLDAQTGWVVGGSSAVFQTTDGGETWNSVHSEDASMQNLNNVYFLDADTGYAVGAKGSVYKSVDSGSNWTAVNDPVVIPEKSLYGIWFFDTMHGFISGDDSTVCETIDGGATWARHALPLPDYKEDIVRVKFFDAMHGIGIGDGNTGTVIVTSDGGATWELVQLGGVFPPGTGSKKLYDLDITGDRYAIIAAYNKVTFFSSDTGHTWQAVGPYTTRYEYAGAGFALDANVMFTGGGQGFLIKTSDGCATHDTLKLGTGSTVKAIHFWNENNGYVITDNGHYFKTNDGGLTWTPKLDWPRLRFLGIAAKNENELFASAKSGGEITKSTDGGLTWSYPENFTSGTASGIYKFEFLTPQKAVISGMYGFIGVSNDGGVSFQPVKTAAWGSNSQFTAMLTAGPDSIWVGSNKGEIFWSFDGGATWTDTVDVGSAQIKDIKRLDAQNFIACSNNGKIYKSYDGGITWTLGNDYGSMSFYDMYFFDANMGYLISSKGYVWKTEDGGETMVTIDTLDTGSNSGYLYGIDFADDGMTGAIVGDYGSIFMTTDGGATWNPVTSPTERTLQNVKFLYGKFWAVGQFGTILSMKPKTTAVADYERRQIPTNYALHQNHPNPFNPSTAITYDLPKESLVKLVVYNVLGQKVRRLIEAKQQTGAHTVQWNGLDDYGRRMATGMYIYRIEAGRFIAVRKMVLMK